MNFIFTSVQTITQGQPKTPMMLWKHVCITFLSSQRCTKLPPDHINDTEANKVILNENTNAYPYCATGGPPTDATSQANLKQWTDPDQIFEQGSEAQYDSAWAIAPKDFHVIASLHDRMVAERHGFSCITISFPKGKNFALVSMSANRRSALQVAFDYGAYSGGSSVYHRQGI